MSTQVLMNLPVKNLNRSMEFFTSLGFTFNPRFTDEKAACMILAENIFVMLLSEATFRAFTPKEVCDAKQSTEVMLALTRKSRAEVDEIVRKAIAAGGSTWKEPQENDFMYSHEFQDLDGHVWEPVFMEPDH